MLWTPTSALVQRLLAAKRDLRLPQELAKLDKFACVILDDIGYVQHDRDEMEVLFTFLAERYERKSVMITTNLVFSEWERIFKDPMTTMAAIDRLVHHSIILDMMSVESYRAEVASLQHLSSARPKKCRPGMLPTMRRWSLCKVLMPLQGSLLHPPGRRHRQVYLSLMLHRHLYLSLRMPQETRSVSTSHRHI